MNIFDFILSSWNIIVSLHILNLLLKDWTIEDLKLLQRLIYLLIYIIIIALIWIGVPVIAKILLVLLIGITLLRKTYRLEPRIFIYNICNYIVIMLGSDVIGITFHTFAFDFLTNFSPNTQTLIMTLLGNSFAYIIVIFIRSQYKYNFSHTVTRDLVLILIPMFISILILYFINIYYPFIRSGKSDGFILLLLLILALIILNIYISHFNLKLKENERVNLMKNANDKQQFVLFKAKQDEQEKLQDLYHDMKNHLLTLRLLTSDIEATNYIDTMINYIKPYEQQDETGIPLLDAMLLNKKSEIQDCPILIDNNLYLPKLNDLLSPFDVSSLFGNLLDNAIEACKNSEVPSTITLNGLMQPSMIIIKIENPALCKINYKNTRLVTNKPDTFLHGRGIDISKKIVKKYNGHMKITVSENFKVIISIPV